MDESLKKSNYELNEIKRLKSEVSEFKKAIATLKDQALQADKVQDDEADASLTELKDSRNYLLNDFVKVKDKEQKLESRNSDVRAELRKCDLEIANLKSNKDDVAKNILYLEQEFYDIKKQIAQMQSEKSRLRTVVQNYQSKKDAIIKDREEVATQRSNYQSEVDQLQKLISGYEQILINEQSENDKLISDSSGHERKVRELRNKSAKLYENLERYRNINANLSEQVKVKKDELQKLSVANSSVEEKYTHLVGQKSYLNKELHHLTSKIQELERLIPTRHNRTTELVTENKNLSTRLVNTKTKIKNLKDQSTLLSLQIENYTKARESAQKELDLVNSEFSLLQMKASEVVKILEKVKNETEANRKELNVKRQMIDERVRETKILAASIKGRKQENETLVAQIEDKKRVLAQIAKDQESIANQITAINQEGKELLAQKSDYLQQNEASQSKKAELQRTLEHKKDMYIRLCEEVKAIDQNHSNYRTEVQNLSMKISETENNLKMLSEHKRMLQDKVTPEIESRNLLSKKLKDLEEAVEVTNAKIDHLQSLDTDNEAELEALRAKVKASTNLLMNLREGQGSLEHKNKDFNTKINDLARRSRTLDEQLYAAKSEKQQLNYQVTDGQKGLEKRYAVNATLSEEVAREKLHIERLAHKLSAVKKEIESITTENHSKKLEAGELVNRRRHMEQMIEQLENRKEALLDNIELSFSEVESNNERMKDLDRSHRKLTSDVNQLEVNEYSKVKTTTN